MQKKTTNFTTLLFTPGCRYYFCVLYSSSWVEFRLYTNRLLHLFFFSLLPCSFACSEQAFFPFLSSLSFFPTIHHSTQFYIPSIATVYIHTPTHIYIRYINQSFKMRWKCRGKAAKIEVNGQYESYWFWYKKKEKKWKENENEEEKIIATAAVAVVAKEM